MKKIKILTTLLITGFIFTSSNAYSQELSANPWVQQNSKETIENIYKQRNKTKQINQLQNSSNIDTSSAYQANPQNDDNILDNIKGFFKSNKNETPDIAQTANQSQTSAYEQRRKSLRRGNFSRPRPRNISSTPKTSSNKKGFLSLFNKNNTTTSSPKKSNKKTQNTSSSISPNQFMNKFKRTTNKLRQIIKK